MNVVLGCSCINCGNNELAVCTNELVAQEKQQQDYSDDDDSEHEYVDDEDIDKHYKALEADNMMDEIFGEYAFVTRSEKRALLTNFIVL